MLKYCNLEIVICNAKKETQPWNSESDSPGHTKYFSSFLLWLFIVFVTVLSHSLDCKLLPKSEPGSAEKDGGLAHYSNGPWIRSVSVYLVIVSFAECFYENFFKCCFLWAGRTVPFLLLATEMQASIFSRVCTYSVLYDEPVDVSLQTPFAYGAAVYRALQFALKPAELHASSDPFWFHGDLPLQEQFADRHILVAS